MTTIELIDDTIKELDNILNKAKHSSDPEAGEASIMLEQSYIEGLTVMHHVSRNRLSILQRQILQDKPYQEPPKELAEFKADFLKDMRKTIRERFQGILSDLKPPSGTPPGQQIDIAYQRLTQELMRLDKELVNQIASIRQELPESMMTPLGGKIPLR